MAMTVQILKAEPRARGLCLLLDREPDMTGLRFQHRDGLWWGEADGMVQFYAWRGPGNERGFGGDTFRVTTVDDKVVELLGPWSSRPGVMNRAGFPACVEAWWASSPEAFEEGSLRYGHVLVDLVRASGLIQLEKRVNDRGEPTWHPVAETSKKETT